MARNIEVRILGDNNNLRSALDDSEHRVRGWASNFGKIVAAGAAAAAVAVGAGLAASVNQAVNLGESINAVEVTFGDAAAGIKQLGEEAAQAVGLSNAEFNGLAVQFSSFAETVAGPGGDVVQTMDDLTTRASDFASVMNLDVSEAAAVFQSGLAGETEPLKKFGIDLSATAVEAYALANGILASGEEMTEAQKVQARYGLLMEQTAVTQGDFANTSDSLANRQRVLMATVKDLAARIGSALLPILSKVATVIAEKLVPWLEKQLPRAIEVVRGIVGSVAAFIQKHWGTVTDAFGRTVDEVRRVVDFFRNNQPALIGLIAALAAAFLAWAGAAAAAALSTIAAAAPFIALVAAIGAVVAALVYAYQNWEGFREVVDAVVAWLRDVAWPAIQQFAAFIIESFRALVEWVRVHWDEIRAVVDAVVAWFRDVAYPAIKAVIDTVVAAFAALVEWVRTHWEEIRGTIENIITAIRAIIETVIAAIKVAWQTWGDELVAYLKVTWDTIKAVVQAAIDIVRGIIQTVAALIRGDWSSAWDGIKDILSGVWDAMKAIVSGALATLKLAIQGAWDGIKLLTEFVWDGIKAFLSGVWDTIKSIVSSGIDAIVGFVSGLPGRITSAVSGAFEGIWTGFKSVVNRVIDAWNGLEFPGISIPGFDPPGPGSFPGFSTPSIGFPNVPRLHTGGVVPGRGEVPILAMGGEVVFTEDQMKALRGGAGAVGFQVNGDVKLDGVTTEQVAQRVLFAMAAA